MLDDFGVSGGNLTVSGTAVACIAWIWRKINGVETKVNAIELKIAEQYVTRPEVKILEDKLDRHNEILTGKIDNVNNNLLTLTNLMLQKD